MSQEPWRANQSSRQMDQSQIAHQVYLQGNIPMLGAGQIQLAKGQSQLDHGKPGQGSGHAHQKGKMIIRAQSALAESSEVEPRYIHQQRQGSVGSGNRLKNVDEMVNFQRIVQLKKTGDFSNHVEDFQEQSEPQIIDFKSKGRLSHAKATDQDSQKKIILKKVQNNLKVANNPGIVDEDSPYSKPRPFLRHTQKQGDSSIRLRVVQKEQAADENNELSLNSFDEKGVRIRNSSHENQANIQQFHPNSGLGMNQTVVKHGSRQQPKQVAPRSTKSIIKPRQLSGVNSSFGLTPMTSSQQIPPHLQRAFPQSDQLQQQRQILLQEEAYQISDKVDQQQPASLGSMLGADSAALQNLLTPENNGMVLISRENGSADLSYINSDNGASSHKFKIGKNSLKLKAVNPIAMRTKSGLVQAAGISAIMPSHATQVHNSQANAYINESKKKKLKRTTSSSDSKNQGNADISAQSLGVFPSSSSQMTSNFQPQPPGINLIPRDQSKNKITGTKKFVSKQKKVVSNSQVGQSLNSILVQRNSVGGEPTAHVIIPQDMAQFQQSNPQYKAQRPQTSMDQNVIRNNQIAYGHGEIIDSQAQFLHHHLASAQIQGSNFKSAFPEDNISQSRVTQMSSLSPQKVQYVSETNEMPFAMQGPEQEFVFPTSDLNLQLQSNSDQIQNPQVVFGNQPDDTQMAQYLQSIQQTFSQQEQPFPQRLRISDLSCLRPDSQIRVSIGTGPQKSNKNASVKSSKSNKKSIQTSNSNTNKRKKSISKKKQSNNMNNFSNIQQHQHVMSKIEPQIAKAQQMRKKSKDHPSNQRNQNLLDGSGSLGQVKTQINSQMMSGQPILAQFLKSPIYTNQGLPQNIQSASNQDNFTNGSCRGDKAQLLSSSGLSKKLKKKRSSINDRNVRNTSKLGIGNGGSLTDYHHGQASMITNQKEIALQKHLMFQSDSMQIENMNGQMDPQESLSMEDEVERLKTVDDYNQGDLAVHQQILQESHPASLPRGKISSISPNRVSPFYLNKAYQLQTSKNGSLIALQNEGQARSGQQSLDRQSAEQQQMVKNVSQLWQEMDKKSMSSHASNLLANQQLLSPTQLLHFQKLINNQNLIRNTQTINLRDNKISEGSPSQKSRISKKSRQSKRSRQSRMSRFSRQSRQRKVHNYQSLVSQGEERLSYGKEIEDDYSRSMERKSSILKQGHESASSKVQKKLMIQQTKNNLPQTTANIQGGALRLDPNKNPNLDPRDSLVTNAQVVSSLNEQFQIESQPHNKEAIHTNQAHQNLSTGRFSLPLADSKQDFGLRPRLDIVIPDDHSEDTSPQVQQPTREITPVQPDQMVSSIQDTDMSPVIISSHNDPDRKRRSSHAGSQQRQSKILKSISGQKMTYVFNNQDQLRKQEVNMQNLLEQQQKQSEQPSKKVGVSKRGRAFSKNNSDNVLNSIRKQPESAGSSQIDSTFKTHKQTQKKNSTSHSRRDTHSVEIAGKAGFNQKFSLDKQHSVQVYQPQAIDVGLPKSRSEQVPKEEKILSGLVSNQAQGLLVQRNSVAQNGRSAHRSNEAQRQKAEQIMLAYQGLQYGQVLKSKRKRIIKQKTSVQNSQQKRNSVGAYISTLSSRVFGHAGYSEEEIRSLGSLEGGGVHSADNRNPYLSAKDSKISLNLFPAGSSRAGPMMQTSVKKKNQILEGEPMIAGGFSAYHQLDHVQTLKDNNSQRAQIRKLVGRKQNSVNQVVLTSMNSQLRGNMGQGQSCNLLESHENNANIQSIDALVQNIGKATKIITIANSDHMPSQSDLRHNEQNVYSDFLRNRGLRNPKQTRSLHCELNESDQSSNPQLSDQFSKNLSKNNKPRKREGFSTGMGILSTQKRSLSNQPVPTNMLMPQEVNNYQNPAQVANSKGDSLISIMQKQFSLKRANKVVSEMKIDHDKNLSISHILRQKQKEYPRVKGQPQNQRQDMAYANSVRRALSGAQFEISNKECSRGTLPATLRTFHGEDHKMSQAVNMNNFLKQDNHFKQSSLPQIEKPDNISSITKRKKKYKISRAPSSQINSQQLRVDHGNSREDSDDKNMFYRRQSSTSLQENSEESIILLNERQRSPIASSKRARRNNKILPLSSKNFDKDHKKVQKSRRQESHEVVDYRGLSSQKKLRSLSNQPNTLTAPNDYLEHQHLNCQEQEPVRLISGLSDQDSDQAASPIVGKQQINNNKFDGQNKMDKFGKFIKSQAKDRSPIIQFEDQSTGLQMNFYQESQTDHVAEEASASHIQSFNQLDHPQSGLETRKIEGFAVPLQHQMSSEHKIVNIDGQRVMHMPSTSQSMSSRRQEAGQAFKSTNRDSHQASAYERIQGGGNQLPQQDSRILQPSVQMRNNFMSQSRGSQQSSNKISSSKHTRQMGTFLNNQIKPKTQRRQTEQYQQQKFAKEYTVGKRTAEKQSNYGSYNVKRPQAVELNIMESDSNYNQDSTAEALTESFLHQQQIQQQIPNSQYDHVDHSSQYRPVSVYDGTSIGPPLPLFATPFNHLCTVESSSQQGMNQGQAHKNTITSLCIVPFKGKKNPTSTKLFSSSLDSTIKCWNFKPYDSEEGLEPFHRLEYSHNEIQANGRVAKRIKTNSLAYFSNFDLLVSGGTDRFINIYENSKSGSSSSMLHASQRYRCATKITKQGSSVINKMCPIDQDKLLVGSSDEHIRLYSLSRQSYSQSWIMSKDSSAYHFDISGINNLCPLNDTNLFISSGNNRNISVWDTRQEKPLTYFKDIHYDTITSLSKLSENIFASSSLDGFINIWDLRIADINKQLKSENNEPISCIKFVGQNTPNYNSINSMNSSPSDQTHLLVAHSNKLSVLSQNDNFTKRSTFKLGGNQFLSQEQNFATSLSSANSREDAPAANPSQWESLLDKSSFKINQIEFDEYSQSVYLGLQSTYQPSSKSVSTISVWNLNFNALE